MSGTFQRRTDELLDQVGDGDLSMHCIVDQVYARYQHEGLDFKHPQGGQAKYLEEPLYEEHQQYLQDLAGGVLDGSLQERASLVAEDLAAQVQDHAPVEFNDLRRSGHPIVKDNGATIYDRAPAQRRLTEEELRAKGQARRIQGLL